MPGTVGSLVTSAGTWTFGSGTNTYGTIILLNGHSAAAGGAAELEVANGGNLYAQVVQGQWDVWNGSGWSGSVAPPASLRSLPLPPHAAPAPPPASPSSATTESDGHIQSIGTPAITM